MAAAWINTKQLSCEIARIRTRAIHLTTGTFNLVCQRPTALPPERAPFGPKRILGITACQKHAATHDPPVLETVTPYRPRHQVSIRGYHRISTCFQPTPAQSTWSFPSAWGKPRNLLWSQGAVFERAAEHHLPLAGTLGPHGLAKANRAKPTRKTIVPKRSLGGSCESA